MSDRDKLHWHRQLRKLFMEGDDGLISPTIESGVDMGSDKGDRSVYQEIERTTNDDDIVVAVYLSKDDCDVLSAALNFAVEKGFPAARIEPAYMKIRSAANTLQPMIQFRIVASDEDG